MGLVGKFCIFNGKFIWLIFLYFETWKPLIGVYVNEMYEL